MVHMADAACTTLDTTCRPARYIQPILQARPWSKSSLQAKFMQSLHQGVYEQLERIAKERGITVQELVRAVVVPEWMRIRKGSSAPNAQLSDRNTMASDRNT